MFLHNLHVILNRSVKKTTAILLLCCFWLYHFGYYGLYFSFTLQVEKQWGERIYNDSSTASMEKILEIPLSLPYMVSEEEFRIANTSFEKNGQYFRIIKQRYVNDTLQVVYVPDTAKRNINEKIKLWVTSLVQDELPDGTNKTPMSKIFDKDYVQPSNSIHFASLSETQKSNTIFISSIVEKFFSTFNGPPPEV